MAQAGMRNEASYDHGAYPRSFCLLIPDFDHFVVVLTSDYAALLVEEFGRNPVVNDEAAFDIHPSFVVHVQVASHPLISVTPVLCISTLQATHPDRP